LDYCITVRALKGNRFGDDPGPTSFLEVPSGANDFDGAQVTGSAIWVKAVLAQLKPFRDSSGVSRSDLVVFIHGFDNKPPIILQRHRQLQSDLVAAGFDGLVVSFDWPSGDTALAYLHDRDNARQTALALVRDCIELFVRAQTATECDVNVHILAHSTGAYVVREAFDDADHRKVPSSVNWTASQIAFIGGDISATSLTHANPETESIFRHCVRLTNYSNPFDEVLQLSNVKRAGLTPRVGRVGLPSDAPSTAVNVDCGDYYQVMIKERDPATIIGIASHSWHIGDPVFTADLAHTLNGDLDRRAIPTRKQLPTGQFQLNTPTVVVAAAATTPVSVASPNPP
jgi:hypothetical protein